MSNISTVIDAVRQAIPLLAGFSDKAEIPNPYSLADNDSQFLENGWGLSILSSSLSSINTFKDHSESRQMVISLTKQFVSIEGDNDAIHTDSKILLEDALILSKDLLDFDQLGIDSSVQKIDFVSNSGIEFVIGNKFNFIFTETIFNFDISESL